MPKAIALAAETEYHTLKSAPPDGWITLRRMTFGESVARRSMLTMSVAASKGSRDFKGEMAMSSVEITRFEFEHCIVDHNLEDENGQKLNLSLPVDFSRLDPRIGQEIEKLISEMNNLVDGDDELGN